MGAALAACQGGSASPPPFNTGTFVPTPIPTASPAPAPCPPHPFGSVYVANFSVVDVFTTDLRGDQTPTRKIVGGAGSNSGIQLPRGVALDTAGNLYVTSVAPNGDSLVNVFAPGASGDVAPIRSIRVTNTLGSPTFFNGLAFDASGNLYVADGSAQNVKVFAPGANGNATPIRTITGFSKRANGVALDAAGNLYVTVDISGAPGSDAVLVFAPGANGNAVPIRTIAGANTGLNGARLLTLDAAGNVYVPNIGNDSVRVFAPAASGDVAPIRTVAGPATGLHAPFGIAVDAAGYWYVTDGPTSAGQPGEVTVYGPGATGNVAPSCTLTGPHTGLSTLAGIVLGS